MIYSDLLGVILSVLSALFNAANRALLSKPLTKTDPRLVNYLTAVVGVLFTLAIGLSFNQLPSFFLASSVTVIIFLLVGVINFGISRVLFFVSIKNIGANQASALGPTSILFSFTFAVIILAEQLNAITFVGGCLVIIGALFIEARSGAGIRRGNTKIGVMSIMLSNAIFGFSLILVRAGLSYYHEYISATLFSYIGALLFVIFTYNPRRLNPELHKIPRASLISVIVAAVFIACSQLLRFASLNFAPVVIVAPVSATSPIFVILFTRFVAREYEIFNFRTIASILLIVTGAVIVSYSSGLS